MYSKCVTSWTEIVHLVLASLQIIPLLSLVCHQCLFLMVICIQENKQKEKNASEFQSTTLLYFISKSTCSSLMPTQYNNTA